MLSPYLKLYLWIFSHFTRDDVFICTTTYFSNICTWTSVYEENVKENVSVSFYTDKYSMDLQH